MLDVDAKLHVSSNSKQRDFMRVRHVEAHSLFGRQRWLAIRTVNKLQVFRLFGNISGNHSSQKPTAHQKVPAMLLKIITTGAVQLLRVQRHSKSVTDHVRLLE